MSELISVTVKQGERFVLRCKEMPGAGYVSRAEFDPARARLANSFTELPKRPWMGSPPIGGSSWRRFVFEALEPGASEARLILERPWDPSSAKAAVTCALTVEPKEEAGKE